MASIDRGLDLSGWSDDLRDMLKRRVSESGGVVLIVLAALIAVALSTWSVQDPSFSHATDGPVRNFLGTPGAIGADLLMQLFGLASTVLVLPVAVWGWRIATHRPFDREWMRLSFWLAGTVFGAGFVACLPKSEHWPLPSGRRGVRPLHARRRHCRHRFRLSRSVRRQARRALGSRRRRPRRQRRGAHFDLARPAGARAAESQGPLRPAGDAAHQEQEADSAAGAPRRLIAADDSG